MAPLFGTRRFAAWLLSDGRLGADLWRDTNCVAAECFSPDEAGFTRIRMRRGFDFASSRDINATGSRRWSLADHPLSRRGPQNAWADYRVGAHLPLLRIVVGDADVIGVSGFRQIGECPGSCAEVGGALRF